MKTSIRIIDYCLKSCIEWQKCKSEKVLHVPSLGIMVISELNIAVKIVSGVERSAILDTILTAIETPSTS
jgi:hypothetical protein